MSSKTSMVCLLNSQSKSLAASMCFNIPYASHLFSGLLWSSFTSLATSATSGEILAQMNRSDAPKLMLCKELRKSSSSSVQNTKYWWWWEIRKYLLHPFFIRGRFRVMPIDYEKNIFSYFLYKSIIKYSPDLQSTNNKIDFIIYIVKQYKKLINSTLEIENINYFGTKIISLKRQVLKTEEVVSSKTNLSKSCLVIFQGRFQWLNQGVLSHNMPIKVLTGSPEEHQSPTCLWC